MWGVEDSFLNWCHCDWLMLPELINYWCLIFINNPPHTPILFTVNIYLSRHERDLFLIVLIRFNFIVLFIFKFSYIFKIRQYFRHIGNNFKKLLL